MNTTIKRYIVSSLITFFTTFFAVLSIQIQAGITSADNISYGLIISLILTASRAGVKAVVEALK